ncbi:hypothetical protein M440DRAFT_1388781 [Trichoderma longibrachiatum ATCC 18648]|uniref:OPT-domain-containing protein n=1 Tax=Trichoderma longibrachiatum ATCC 18648 TaxID=983965 RepID=A0A2T4CG28_TRILO|nr:hypothetical protein M440DRAFT_1388781 [Trichoderma longibrachiatum ATCC 18648]
MPALSYFNVITWFAPKSVVLANLFGVSSGLGLFPMTFDWAQITYVGSPLLVPFWAAMNVVGGLAIIMWIIAPLFYYSNVLYSSYMPILSTAVFDNTGKVYDVSKILTPDFLFDREAYSNYSRVFLPVTYMLSYGVQFAGLAALLTHTVCWHGQDIWHTWKESLVEARGQGKEGYEQVSDSPDGPSSPQGAAAAAAAAPRASSSGSHIEGLMSHEDIHSRLMKRYKDAPLSWYFLTFISMAVIGIFVVEYYPVHLPWYGLLLALAIGAIFFIPNGIIMAITNQHSSIYLICQLICGVAFPGRPIANMVFRRANAWWGKYTMTLSAALDSGLAFGIVVVFFGFIYPGWMRGFSWWGTEVYKRGCDWQACSFRNVKEGERFGPDSW